MTFLPCPFCGSQAVVLMDGPWVTCRHCGAEGPVGEDSEHAQELWNSRMFIASETVKNYPHKPDS